MTGALTYLEAAAAIGISHRQVRRLVKRKELAVRRLGHRTVLIPGESLAAFLKRRTVRALFPE